ncbi:uncharacterized protein LOC128396087 [Panonychus citri]|uniref:uncharacterized protein LOC128396087 n=1 Tax=Panonychus citri TaxID=50023 RepID=UPI002307DE3F|nr:uncharacterized protein LOC128396087 [Panonychus citri]
MMKSKFDKFDYELYHSNPNFKQYFKSGSGFWTRWHDCEYITSDCIGKSSTLVLHLPLDDNRTHFIDLVSKFLIWRHYSELEVSIGFIEVIEHRPVDLPIDNFPFKVLYAIQSIQSVSNAFQDDLTVNDQIDHFISIIKCLIATKDIEKLVCALNRLFYEYLYKNVDFGLMRLKVILTEVVKEWKSIKDIKSSSSSCVKLLRRVILTPTRKLILPELTFQSSQFLEAADKDYVLRVSFRDENMNDLGFAVTRKKEDIDAEEKRKKSQDPESKLPSPGYYFLNECIGARLLPSLNVAGRNYRIFGASSSQLRDHGLVLYAEDTMGRDAAKIREEIGSCKAKGISKKLARDGLSLTQSMAFIDMKDVEVRYTKDIEGGKHPDSKNPYTFTDGCGLMSPQLAEYIWSELKAKGSIKVNPDKEMKMPTAYQIRYFGCKGMISLGEKLKGKVIVLRESMRKIDSKPGQLGIVKIADRRQAYLNKPLVTILNQIGLSNNVFGEILSNAIGDLIGSFDCPIKASKALTMFSCLNRFIDHKKLASNGYNLLGDYFFRNSLQLVFHHGLDIIQQKARIPLDFNTARTLFGVADPTATYYLPYVVVPTSDSDDPDSNLIKIFDKNDELIYSTPGGPKKSLFFDETTEKFLTDATSKSNGLGKGLLKYGQVFIFPSDSDKPLTGEVNVTKFPCMDPGDVLELKAIDIPELHGIRDCVFPVDGPRPHADEMAGSDCDGDEFWATWSTIYREIQHSEPMNFPDVGSSETFDESKIDKEIVEFFTNYIQGGVVGRIASSHSVWADMLSDGIKSQICRDLALKYSIALDSVKTGIITNLLDEERYKRAPDHSLHLGVTPSYLSARALGYIYRIVFIYKLFLARTVERKLIDQTLDPRLIRSGSKKYAKQATEAYESYCSIVTCILEMSEFTTEAELLNQISGNSGCERFIEVPLKRANDRQETIIYIINHLLVKKMEDTFYSEFDGMDKESEEYEEAVLAKASAYYEVTFKKSKSNKRFYGLPWIGKYSEHLIKLLSLSDKKSDAPLVTEIDPPSRKGGFNGTFTENHETSELCLSRLRDWCTSHLNKMDATKSDVTRIVFFLEILFSDIANIYVSKKRKRESPCDILNEIFALIEKKRQLFDFENNLFDSTNDLIGLMTFLVLESTYCDGIESSKVPDYWVNSNYRVLVEDETMIDEEIEIFKENLKQISHRVRIVHFKSRDTDEHFTLSIRGSGVSVFICQTLITIHNYIIMKGNEDNIF